jgi:hypothetical protein
MQGYDPPNSHLTFTGLHIIIYANNSTTPKAFPLFAKDWRKKAALQYPRDSNTDISIIFHDMWKSMKKDEKDMYMSLTREVDTEHKRKYAEYVYNPNEARVRKALR